MNVGNSDQVMGEKFGPIPSTEDFSFLYKIQTGSGTNPSSFSMGARSSLSDGKVVAA
jgi:hypothetical protein